MKFVFKSLLFITGLILSLFFIKLNKQNININSKFNIITCKNSKKKIQIQIKTNDND